MVLLADNLNPGKYTFAQPHDSAAGMPLWAYLIAVGVLVFLVVKVWVALKKDKK